MAFPLILVKPSTIHDVAVGSSFAERAIPRNGYVWDAEQHLGHLTVRVGRPGDRFARVAGPFRGHPNRAALYADILAMGML